MIEKTAACADKTAKQVLEENGYGDDNIVILQDESYDSALIGVSYDGRAVYSYERMVDWYMEKNDCSEEDAIDWIEFNTIGALGYAGESAPIIIHELER